MMMNGCLRVMRTDSCAVMAVAFMAALYATSAHAEQIGVQDDTAMTYTITVGEGETVALSAEDAAAIRALDAGYTFVKDGKYRRVIRPQEIEDILALEVDEDYLQ